MKINECTIVAGTKGNERFLFKNGDNPTMWDHEIVRDIVNDVEVAYYTNQNGWVEGMNEYGIGMVYAFLTHSVSANNKFDLQGKTSLPYTNDIDPYYISDKGKYLLSIISSKDIDDGLKIIEENDYDGNYYLSDPTKTYNIEKYDGEMKYYVVEFKKENDVEVKTNHGQQIPTAGHLNNGGNLRRADSEIRKGNAERYLQGFKTFDDVIQRMSFQEYDKKATYNLFRTDSYEKTTSQILLDLKNRKLTFIYYDTNDKFYGVCSKLPKSYQPKIDVVVLNRDTNKRNEYELFRKKESALYKNNENRMLNSFYGFLTEAIDNNKIFFVINNNNIETVTSDNAQPLNKKIDNYVLKNFFSDVVVIQDLELDEIKALTFPENSVVYSFKPKGVYHAANTEKRKKVHLMYDVLKKMDNVSTYMNENVTSSKVETQKMFNDEPYFPKAVFKKEDIADTIGFPVVAKPDSGHSGEGIKKFDNEKEMSDFYKKNPDTQHDIYCEFVNFEREYRALFLENELVYLGERIPKIEKNIDINNKEADEQMAFVYAAQDIKHWPFVANLMGINKSVFEKIKISIYAIDFFLTKDNEIKLIEINSQCGMDPYRMLSLYTALYKKHFDTDLPANKKQLKNELINLFLNNELKHFKKEIGKSLTPVNYKVSISESLLDDVEKMDEYKIK